MKIRVDRGACSGHALCAIRSPDLFPIDDDGFSIADGLKVPPGREEEAWMVANWCPEHAITLEDE